MDAKGNCDGRSGATVSPEMESSVAFECLMVGCRRFPGPTATPGQLPHFSIFDIRLSTWLLPIQKLI